MKYAHIINIVDKHVNKIENVVSVKMFDASNVQVFVFTAIFIKLTFWDNIKSGPR